jgi:hypothetical protein
VRQAAGAAAGQAGAGGRVICRGLPGRGAGKAWMRQDVRSAPHEDWPRASHAAIVAHPHSHRHPAALRGRGQALLASLPLVRKSCQQRARGAWELQQRGRGARGRSPAHLVGPHFNALQAPGEILFPAALPARAASGTQAPRVLPAGARSSCGVAGGMRGRPSRPAGAGRPAHLLSWCWLTTRTACTARPS